MLTKHQSRLQRGFTKRPSSVYATLLISEVQNEAKDRGEFFFLWLPLMPQKHSTSFGRLRC